MVSDVIFTKRSILCSKIVPKKMCTLAVKPKAGIVTDKEELWTIYSFEGLLYIFLPNSK